jgi:Tfp pilus tip-associated adhesin PilY1
LENKERCLGDFLVYSQVVFFLTYIPTSVVSDPCGRAGESNLYGVYYTSGTSTREALFDLTGDGSIDPNDTVVTATGALGGAIVQLSQGFSGGGPIALGDTLYLPLGITVEISPPGELPETGVTSWKEVWD